jgi:hypothetical protein
MPALAGDCPAAGREERLGLIEKASSCLEAARLFEHCGIGASLDGELALRVSQVCEKTSLAKMPEQELEAYGAAIDACNARYARKRGSMYRSASALQGGGNGGLRKTLELSPARLAG